MTAKHKLNAANINGALLIAAVVGTLAGSWIVFFIVASLLISSGLHDGSIRR